MVEKKGFDLFWVFFLLQTLVFSPCLTYNAFSASEITGQTTRDNMLTICLWKIWSKIGYMRIFG